MKQVAPPATPARLSRRSRALSILAVTFIILAGATGIVFAGKSTIGDLVWHDANVDGIQDANENGIDDVDVELWYDVDKNGVLDPTIDERLLVTTTTTDAAADSADDAGYYLFPATGGTSYDPQWYLVVITDTNFTTGVLKDYVYTGDLNPGGEYEEPFSVVLQDIQIDEKDVDFPYALAALEMVKTAGNAADGDIEYLQGDPPVSITYTYRVTNTGDVILDILTPPYVLDDDKCDAGFTLIGGDTGTFANLLDPGETWVIQCTQTLNGGDLDANGQITNTATITGNPKGIDPDSGLPVVDLPGNKPQDVDDAVVDVVKPGVLISKTVYVDHDGGASCAGVNEITEPIGTDITYCFVVTNTGDTDLSIEVDDPDLGVTFGPQTVAAGMVVTFSQETAVTTNITNTAAVTGTPLDPEGEVIPDIEKVTDDDTARVNVMPPSFIGDYIWYDADKDGYQDVDEPGIGNVTVQLSTDPGFGSILDEVTTGTDGGYIFTALPEGTYYVRVKPDELAAGTPPAGTLDGYTASPLGFQSHDPATPIVLGQGEFYEDADFGFFIQPPANTAIIGDSVWYYGDGDGIQDPGEPGIPGITVVVTDSNGVPYTAITDENGVYQVEVPADGVLTYEVSVQNPPPGTTATTDETQTVPALNPGDQYLDADFGYEPDVVATIGDQVWIDTNPDGLYIVNEDDPVPGVTVDLVDPATGTIVATTVTDENGYYLFEGVLDGNYEVVVTDTSNVLADYVPTLTSNSQGIDSTNKIQPFAVTVTSGVGTNIADFGYVLNSTTGPEQGVIGNQVFFDVDGDGVYEPELGDFGIEGVEMVLTDSNDNTTTVTSGSQGLYAFTGLGADDYTVEVANTTANQEILGEYVITTLGPDAGDAAPPVDGTDNQNQVDPFNVAPYAVTLSSDTDTDFTADFGYTKDGEIGDYVWWDINQDGIQDPDEPGIEGVLVELYDENGVKVDSTTTVTDGAYLFENVVAPITYTVVISNVNFGSNEPLENFTSTLQFEGSDTAVDSNGAPGPNGTVEAEVELERGVQDETIDFGMKIFSDIAIEKVVTFPDPIEPVRIGDPVTFTIRLTNTGDTIIVNAPLTDTYDAEFLQFDYAVPAETTAAAGLITWNDALSAPQPLTLAPLESAEVVVVFEAIKDTTDPATNPDDAPVTINTALVNNLTVDPDGLNEGLDPSTIPPDPKEDDAEIEIQNPTSVLIAAANVEKTDQGAAIEWTTVTEAEIVGFNVWRTVGGSETKVNGALILARNAGQASGNTYTMVDTAADPDAITFYFLEIVTVDNREESHGLGGVNIIGSLRIFLPMLYR